MAPFLTQLLVLSSHQLTLITKVRIFFNLHHSTGAFLFLAENHSRKCVFLCLFLFDFIVPIFSFRIIYNSVRFHSVSYLFYYPWLRIALTCYLPQNDLVNSPLNTKLRKAPQCSSPGKGLALWGMSLVWLITSLLRSHGRLSVSDSLVLILSMTDRLLLPDITSRHFGGDSILLVRSMSSESPAPAGFLSGVIVLFSEPHQSHFQVLLICGVKRLWVAWPLLLILPLPMKLISLTRIFISSTVNPLDLQTQVVSSE